MKLITQIPARKRHLKSLPMTIRNALPNLQKVLKILPHFDVFFTQRHFLSAIIKSLIILTFINWHQYSGKQHVGDWLGCQNLLDTVIYLLVQRLSTDREFYHFSKHSQRIYMFRVQSQ
jgi:hypothetical protein